MISEKRRLHLLKVSKMVRTKEWRDKIRITKLGDKNPNWVGENIGYNGLHAWVKRRFKKPKECSLCGKVTNILDLANKGVYDRKLKNWEWLCRKCHMIKDGRLEKLICIKKR